MADAYRNENDALRERAEGLHRELADVEARRGELHRQIEDVKKQQAHARKRGLPMLENIKIASPCSARWDEMTGDARVRFCAHCQKNVYNLSEMSRADAEKLVAEKEGNLCVRMYQRTDGTVLTADCPVGVRRKRMRRAAALAAGGGILAALSALGAALTVTTGKPCATGGAEVMGDVTSMPVTGSAVVEPPPAPTQTHEVLQGKPSMPPQNVKMGRMHQ